MRKERSNVDEAGVAPATSEPSMGFKEFVALMAALMAVTALSIDVMLPVLPQIGEALGIATEDEQQWVVTSYSPGFGVARLFYGVPDALTDRIALVSVQAGNGVGVDLG